MELTYVYFKKNLTKAYVMQTLSKEDFQDED